MKSVIINGVEFVPVVKEKAAPKKLKGKSKADYKHEIILSTVLKKKQA